MRLKPVVIGIATHIPGMYNLYSRTGGTDSARYCYSIWLRHLVLAHQHNLISSVPSAVAELGPGDSLGIGMAALLSGVQTYHALDLIRYATTTKNLTIFDELVDLFIQRADIPGDAELSLYNLRLESYQFPAHIITDAHLEHALDVKRLQGIRDALIHLENKGMQEESTGGISYVVPWDDPGVIAEASIDMIYSQAVLEHVDNLDLTYRTLYQWLKPGGIISYTIDFACHGTADAWNGHWSYSSSMWKLIRGRRAYLINRQPHSSHIALLHHYGFDIVYEKTRVDTSGITREKLAPEFKALSDTDLVTRSAFIQARKQH